MFPHEVAEARYRDPWDIPFEDRFAALRKSKTRIAYYYHQPDNSTFRYRCYNMAQAINALLPGVSASHFSLDDGPGLDRVIEAADILVVCRARYTDALNRMITRAKGLGRQVFYDIDDLVFDPRYVHLVINTLDQEITEEAWDHWFAYIGRLGATMRLCDRVIVTNETLAAGVLSFDGRPARVIPNFMNREQLDISRRIFDAKRGASFASAGPIELGYFSGTPTHNRDFQMIAPALAQLLDRDERLCLRLVGFLDLGDALRRHDKRITRYPLQDFVNLQRLIGETEINLVPLQDNAFTNCKSTLKYFEAGATGSVSVASPTVPYQNDIKDGCNAYLAQAHQWEGKLTAVLADLGAYASVAGRAYEDSITRYGWQAQAAALEAALLAA